MFVFFEFFAPLFEKLWITHRHTAQIAARKPDSAPAETSMLDPACASSLTPLEDSGIRIGSWLCPVDRLVVQQNRDRYSQ